MNGTAHQPAKPDYDVIVIGAGISGINSAYQTQTQLAPGTTYAVLERRANIGGTWDLFKYPGIRSDSDLYTFGFPWRPWREGKAIAEAASIVKYMEESVEWAGIDKHIKFGHHVVGADWSSRDLLWTLDVEVDEKPRQITARFIILGTGYYDYDHPLETTVPGLENFAGQVIHPQFWPEQLDYTNKEVAIIGSGATAVTLLPNLARTAKLVTMVQRSPSYVLALPNKDTPLARLIRFVFPENAAHWLLRWRWILTSYAFFYFCRSFPNAARSILRAVTKRLLPKDFPHDPHFNPRYNPWEQRLCVSPDGDFFKAMRQGKATVVTSAIKSVTKDGISMENGQEVKADIIVTATGLKIQLIGGIRPTVDGKEIDIPSRFMWKGVMLQDLPNAAVVIGYTNASWTLGANATATLICRLINLMQKKGALAAVPRLADPGSMKSTPMLNLNSTYINRALDIIPKSGDQGQWRPRGNYMGDIREAKYGDIETNIEFLGTDLGAKARANGAANGAANGKPAQPRI